jgi:integrase/recombinase XerD
MLTQKKSIVERANSRAKLDWLPALDRLNGAYSENTLRSYRGDFTIFEAWCRENGYSPLPASPETVAAFITQDAKKSASATLRRRLTSIRKVHHLLRLNNPIIDEEVVIAYRRALRTKALRPKQALGLTKDLRNRLIAACPKTLSGLRNRALIAVGYDTLCRRSELVGLRLEDFTFKPGRVTQVLIRRSKNDPFGNGRIGFVGATAVVHLQAWLKAAGIGTGWIFRAVRDENIAKESLDPSSVNRILKAMALDAALSQDEITQLSGHSMRVGAAQDMSSSGLGLLPIMQAGGWKCVNVVARYTEHSDLTQLIERFRGIHGSI